MRSSRRRLLVGFAPLVAAAGCITDPGPTCPGATVRLSLSPIDSIDDPLVLDDATLSTEAAAVVETAVGGEHVEHCVTWNPEAGETGPSAGLGEVGDRVAAHAGVNLAARRTDVETTAVRDGTGYRLVLRIEVDDE